MERTRRRPDTALAVVGSMPGPKILQLGAEDKPIEITGTVPDIRPYLWGCAVSIVRLRIGGGTRLKIYEAMAAKIPVISTTIGAEGLVSHPPDDIRMADTPEGFADQCLELLDDPAARERVSAAADGPRQLLLGTGLALLRKGDGANASFPVTLVA